MTPEKKSNEEIAKSIVNKLTREDDGLLDVGKYDHEYLKDLILEELNLAYERGRASMGREILNSTEFKTLENSLKAISA